MSKSLVLETPSTTTTSLPDLLAKVDTLAADFATRASIYDRNSSFPFENFEALHKAQLLSLTIPVEFTINQHSITIKDYKIELCFSHFVTSNLAFNY